MNRRQYLIVGAGRFGAALTEALFEKGHEVVVVDRDERRVEAVAQTATQALVADSTDEEVLRRLGVGNFDAVVVAIGADFESSVLTTVSTKALGAKRVIAKAASKGAAAVLARVGADRVVMPEHDMGTRLADHLSTPQMLDAFELGLRHAVVEIQANERLAGTLAHLRLPNRFNVQVIAINREGDVSVSPGATFAVQPGDVLVVIGKVSDVERFRAFVSG